MLPTDHRYDGAVVKRSVPSAPLVGPFADRLLRLDLPELDAARRDEVVAFTCRRVDGLPSVMRLGVVIIAAVFRGGLAVGGDALVRVVSRLALPLVGEYVRLIRSLAYTYIWETWPDTSPLGGVMA
jgi:hypothetical protein